MSTSQHEVPEVTAFLENRFPDVSDVAPIGSGAWSQAFSFRTGDRDRVVRFGQYRGDYEKDRHAMRFAAADLPIPRVVEIGDAFDGAYAVSERAFGTGFDGRSEADYRRILPSVFATLAALARVDVSGTRGYGMWKADADPRSKSWQDLLLDREPMGDRVHGWQARLESVPEAARVFEESHGAMDRLVGDAVEDRHLIHADFMGDNVLIADDRVVAVVDWGNALYGDFLYDLARITFYAPWFPGLERCDPRALAEDAFRAHGLVVPNFHARLRCCEVHIGIDAQIYCAFIESWDELERQGKRTLELASRQVG